MICKKCKHEMPDGIRYCGHCGRKMTVVEYVINWSFDKKRLPITLIVLALVIGLLVWGVVSLVSGSANDELPVDSTPGTTPAAVYDGPALYPDLRTYLGEDNWIFTNNSNVMLLTDGTNGIGGYMANMTVDKDAAELLYDYMDLLVEEYHYEELTSSDTGWTFRFVGTNAPDAFSGGSHLLISIVDEDDEYLYIRYSWQEDLERVDVQP